LFGFEGEEGTIRREKKEEEAGEVGACCAGVSDAAGGKEGGRVSGKTM